MRRFWDLHRHRLAPVVAERLEGGCQVAGRVEVRAGHIGGSTHLSRQVLEIHIGEIVPDPSTPVVVYCTVGHRSALAADTLQKLGYRSVASIAGGLNAYLAASRARKSA